MPPQAIASWEKQKISAEVLHHVCHIEQLQLNGQP